MNKYEKKPKNKMMIIRLDADMHQSMKKVNIRWADYIRDMIKAKLLEKPGN